MPTSTEYVCITAANAAVTVNSTATVTGLLLGSGDTVDIQTGGVSLAGGSGVSPSALQGGLTVESGATLSVGASAQLVNASGATLTNKGTVPVAGTFDQDAGVVATGSADNPVQLADGSSMEFTGSGAGAFQVANPASDAITVSLSGDLASGQVFEMPAQDNGSGNDTTTVNAAASFTNAGTIAIDHTGNNNNSSAVLNLPSGDTLTNTGTINVSGDPGGSSSSGDNETINGNVANQGTFNVGVSSKPGAYLTISSGSTFTNTGTVTVANATTSSNNLVSTLAVVGTFVNGSSGSIANQGSVLVPGTFKQGDGTVATGSGDNPVQLETGSTMDFTGTGAGAFQVANPASDAITMSLSGNLASDQVFEMPAQDNGTGSLTTTVNAAASFTNAGTITIDHTGFDSNSSAVLNLPSGDTLTNSGTINVSGDPAGSTATADNETINGNVANQGTFNVGVSGKQGAYLTLAAGSTFTNTGTVTVANAATSSNNLASTFAISPAASGGTPPAAGFVNDGGTVTDQGTLLVDGAFTQGNGAVATGAGDNPVELADGSRMRFAGTGAGVFQVDTPTSDTMTVSLSGDLAPGQVFEMPAEDNGFGIGTTTVNAAASFTNAGTITIDHTGFDSHSSAVLNLPSGDTLTNSGTINVSGDPAGSTATSDNETINGNVANQGTFNVGVSGKPGAYMTLGSASTFTNTGTVTVANATTSSNNLASTLVVPGTWVNGSGGGITDQGTFLVTGSFRQGAGTVATGSGDNPVELANGSTMDFTGSGAGAFQVNSPSTDTMTVSLSGDLASGQVFEMPAEDNGFGIGTTTVNAAASFTNAGTITIDHTGFDSNSSAVLNLPAGDTLTNTGTINVSGDPAGSSPTGDNETINGNVANKGTFNVGVSGKPAAYLIIPTNTTFTNDGTVNVTSGDTVAATGTVINASGTFNVPGNFDSSATFIQQGGSTTNGSVQITGGALKMQGTGQASLVVPAGSSPTLSGNIAPGQTLTINDNGGVCGGTIMTASAPFTNAGTIDLVSNTCSTAPAELVSSGLVTNSGTINFNAVSGGAGEIDAAVDNTQFGTITTSNGGLGKIGGTLTNDGTLTVNWGNLTLNGLSNEDASTHTLTGGTYEVLGSSGDPATLTLPTGLLGVLDASLVVGSNATAVQTGGGNALTISNIMQSGSLTLLTGSTPGNFLSLGGLLNSGNLILYPSVTVPLSGPYTQKPSGALTDWIGGSSSSGQYGVITASGLPVALGGTLNLEEQIGFTPASGDVYTPITGSVSGRFSVVNGTNLGGGLGYSVGYGSSSVTLTVGPGVYMAASNVTGPTSATPGQPVTVGWTVTATGSQSVSGSWTDAVYLSPSSTVTSNAILMGTVTHTGGLAAGRSYNGSLSTGLPGVLPGTWHFVVVTDASDQTADLDTAGQTAASGPVTVTMRQLPVGGQVSGTIPAGGDLYYEVQPTPGSNVQLTATFTGTYGADASMSLAHGQIPTAATSSLWSSLYWCGGYSYSFYYCSYGSSSNTVQTASIAFAQTGGYFVDLNNPTSLPETFTLSAALQNSVITSVTPSSVGYILYHNDDCLSGAPLACTGAAPANVQPDVALTVKGAGFTPASTATLSCTYTLHPVNAVSVDYVSSSTLYVDFGTLPTPTIGFWGNRIPCTVEVTTGSSTAQAAGAVTLVGDTINTWDGQALQAAPVPNVSVVAPSVNRANQDSFVEVDYSNPYSFSIPAPLMELDATGATLHYPDVPAGHGSSLPLLGTAPTGNPGVLGPGQSGSVEVAFDSTVGLHQNVQFQLKTLDYPGQPAYWGAELDSMLPRGVPQSVINYVREFDLNTSGNYVTGGDLQSMLDRDASYLASIGHPAPDTGALFNFELEQVTNYGALVVNHTDGPLGVGMPGLVDTATVNSTGDVIVSDATGASTVFAALPSGGYEAPQDVQSTLVKASGGGWVMTQPDGSTVTFDSSGRQVATTDAYGNTTTYSYTGANLTSASAPNRVAYTLTYDGSGHVTSIANSATGQTTTYGYDSTGHVTSIAGQGLTQHMSWNQSSNEAVDGTLASVTGPAGVTTSYTYDSQGRRTGATRSDGATMATFSYPSPGTVSVTGPTGGTMTEQLDANGAAARTVLGDGRVLSNTVNSLGEPTSQSLNSTSIQMGYDSNGDLTSITDPAGNTTALSYSQPGVQSSLTQPNGLQWLMQTNSQTSRTSVSDPAGNQTSIAYSSQGRIISLTDRNGARTSYTYTPSGLVQSVTPASGGVLGYGNDAQGNITSASDSSRTTTYTYDSNNRLTGVTYPNGLGLTVTYDSAGRRASETTSDGYTINYHYDSAGNLSSLTDGGGKTIVSYVYNAAGHPTRVTNANGTTTAYTYTAYGDVSSVVNKAPGGSTTSSYSYTHNSLGETTSLTGPNGTTTYSYNGAGELIGASLPGGRSLTYTYDAAGNRTATTDSSSGPLSYTLGADDEYSSVGGTNFTYNKNGDLTGASNGSGTTTYTWNALNQLTSASGPGGSIAYTYDAMGNLVAEDVNGVTRNILADPVTGNILGQYSASNGRLELYPQGAGIVGQVDAAGNISSYGYDGAGNVVSMSDPSGSIAGTYSYLPFGEPAGSTGASAPIFGYAGQYGVTTDPVTGFTQNGVRAYDPAIGRFISQDANFGSARNPYMYANNSPNDNTDVTGLEDCPKSDGAEMVSTALDEGAATAGGLSFLLGQNLKALEGMPPSPEIDELIEQTETYKNALEGEAEGANGFGLIQTEGGLTLGAPQFGIAQALDVANEGLNFINNINCAQQAATPVDTYNAEGQAVINAANSILIVTTPPFPGKVAAIHYAEKKLNEAAGGLLDAYFTDLYSPGPPSAVFGPAFNGSSPTGGSHDPNDMAGPQGYGSHHYIQGSITLPYQVDFSNLATASLPAQTVTVNEPLDSHLSLGTFSLGPFGFAGHTVFPPPGSKSFETVIDDRRASGLDVRVKASLDAATHSVRWTFTSIDPKTGLPTTDGAAGFLPPNKRPPEGDGFVSYTVKPQSSLRTGSTISAHATVRFDTNSPMTTSTVTNTIDNGPPSATISPLPAQETSRTFRVSWSGSDVAGIAGYYVAVSDDKGPLKMLGKRTSATSILFSGKPGHTYSFLVWAVDNVGIVEAPPSHPQAQTTVVSAAVKLLPSKGRVKAGKVALKLNCVVGTCKGKLTLTAVKSHKTYGAHAYSARQGQTVKVKIRLNRAGRKALARAKGKRLKVTERATVTGGIPVSRKLVLRG